MATIYPTPNSESPQTATLAGGCFWCTEAVFTRIQGVISVTPGYTGGHTERPTYAEVSTGRTGHAEAIQIVFDPTIITFQELVEIFFVVHDPTTLNRQGHDVGTQYRSAIFYHSATQKKIAEEVIQKLQTAGVYKAPIVTQIESCSVFYPAEDYHHNYYQRHPNQAYCQVVISPKLAKLRTHYLAKMKPQ